MLIVLFRLVNHLSGVISNLLLSLFMVRASCYIRFAR